MIIYQGREMKKIKSFVYLDVNKMYSISSQIFEGLTEYILSEKTVDKFVEYGVNVWGIDSSKEAVEIAKEAIAKTREFFISIGMPSRLSEINIDETHFDIMSEKAAKGGLKYGFVSLTKEDVKNIFKMAL